MDDTVRVVLGASTTVSLRIAQPFRFDSSPQVLSARHVNEAANVIRTASAAASHQIADVILRPHPPA